MVVAKAGTRFCAIITIILYCEYLAGGAIYHGTYICHHFMHPRYDEHVHVMYYVEYDFNSGITYLPA